MRVFYHIKQLGLIFLENGKTGFFSQNRRSSKHVESILSIPYRDRVAHCFKLAIAQSAVLAEQTHQATEVPIQWQSVSF